MMPADQPLPNTASYRCGVATVALIVGLALTSASSLAGVAVLENGTLRADPASQRLRAEPVPSGVQLIQAQQNPSSRAREQAYIARLEEEIRRLTGRVDQLEFQQRNVDRRVDQLIGDLDQRLSTLESGGVAGATADSGRQEAEQALNDLAATTNPDGVPVPVPAPQAEDGQLGRVPESALATLPRPDPADVAAPQSSTLTPEQQYENAVQLLQAGDYQGAQGGLEIFLDLNGEHQLASNAAYWLAETHYVRQNYSAAAAAFARNYRNYGPSSAKAIDNLLKLGMSLTSLGEQDKACLSYDELTQAFPDRPAHIEQALSRERARAACG